MDWLRDLLVALGLREKPPEVRLDGVVDWVRFDGEFRSKCVVWADGRCMIAEDYGGDAHVREMLVALRDTDAVAGMLREQSGTLEEVAAAWRGGDGVRGSRMADPEKEERLYRILEQAVEAEADDIVLEKGEAGCRVHVIVNNQKLPLGMPMTAEEGEWMIHYLFYCKHQGSRQTAIMKHDFQGWGVGPAEMRMPGKIAALRVERGPDVNDEHMVIRIFAKGRVAADASLEELGFNEEVCEIFREIRMSKYGGIVIAGSTGEGKSTTNTVNLLTQMREHDYRLNMATVEDPVENPVPGAIQIQVAPTGVGEDRSAQFQKGLMHFVRIHPQVGCVGEIRDVEGAKQVLQFIDSGHQIWTTLHAHNANGILFRLLDLGVPAAQLTKPGNIRLLLKQTLISVLCPGCCLDAPEEGRRLPAWLASRLSAEVRYRNPKGCGTCLARRTTELGRLAWAGYSNRLAFAEWIVPDEEYLGFVGARDPIGAWSHWRGRMGGVTVGTKVWRSVADGMVDPFDALAKAARLDEAEEVFGRPGPGLSLVGEDRRPVP